MHQVIESNQQICPDIPPFRAFLIPKDFQSNVLLDFDHLGVDII